MRIFNPNPTYSAFYQKDHSRIIYRRKQNDGTLIPEGAVASGDPRSTYSRTDGGDQFEFAWFTLNGETIIIQRDGHAPTAS